MPLLAAFSEIGTKTFWGTDGGKGPIFLFLLLHLNLSIAFLLFLYLSLPVIKKAYRRRGIASLLMNTAQDLALSNDLPSSSTPTSRETTDASSIACSSNSGSSISTRSNDASSSSSAFQQQPPPPPQQQTLQQQQQRRPQQKQQHQQRTLWLHVEDSSSSAKALYASLGFEPMSGLEKAHREFTASLDLGPSSAAPPNTLMRKRIV